MQIDSDKITRKPEQKNDSAPAASATAKKNINVFNREQKYDNEELGLEISKSNDQKSTPQPQKREEYKGSDDLLFSANEYIRHWDKRTAAEQPKIDAQKSPVEAKEETEIAKKLQDAKSRFFEASDRIEAVSDKFYNAGSSVKNLGIFTENKEELKESINKIISETKSRATATTQYDPNYESLDDVDNDARYVKGKKDRDAEVKKLNDIIGSDQYDEKTRTELKDFLKNYMGSNENYLKSAADQKEAWLEVNKLKNEMGSIRQKAGLSEKEADAGNRINFIDSRLEPFIRSEESKKERAEYIGALTSPQPNDSAEVSRLKEAIKEFKERADKQEWAHSSSRSDKEYLDKTIKELEQLQGNK